MHSIQVDKTIEQIIKIFYKIGVWQRDDESYRRRIAKKLFYTFFGALVPIFFAMNARLCVDQSEAIFSVQIAIMSAILYVKLLYILFKKQEIFAFLYDQTILHSIKDRKEYDQTSEKIKKFMKFVRPYCLAVLATACAQVACKLPIFSDDKGLPGFISFSWNDSETVYWLAYSFLSLSIPLCATLNLITPLIWYILLNYAIEYELLGNKVRNLGVRNTSVKTIAEKQINFKLTERSAYAEDLIVFIKAHRNLMEYDVTHIQKSAAADLTVNLFLKQDNRTIQIVFFNFIYGSNRNQCHLYLYFSLQFSFREYFYNAVSHKSS